MTNIAVVGAGFSGTLLTCQLLNQPGFSGTVYWLERRLPRGRGIAYGTPCRAHVLNVAAQRMSAFPDAPGHFLDWLLTQTPSETRDTLRDTYAPRADYARYIEASTAEIFARGEAEGRLRCINAEAEDLVATGHRVRITVDGAPSLDVDAVALCMGHFAPRMPRLDGAEHLVAPHFIANPWDYKALGNVPRAATVAALGAGLSMVDVALQLHAQGFAGQLVAVSRRGFLPRSHLTQPTSITLAPPPTAGLTARTLVRWLREKVGEHKSHGGDWRQVLDALRPHTVALWRALDPCEQARILRHAKSSWDVHRHRVAPEVDRLLGRLRHAGTLLHHAGRLVGAEPGRGGRGLRLHWQLRHHAEPWRQDVDVLVNCTGAHSVWPRTQDSLPGALLARGSVRPGPHNLGLDVDAEGAVRDHSGRAHGALWAMGPARLGTDFESVAVPELRVQAQQLAQRLARVGGAG